VTRDLNSTPFLTDLDALNCTATGNCFVFDGGVVYEPSNMFNALYRLDKSFGSKTLLHQFDKNAPNEKNINVFAHMNGKIHLHMPEYQKQTMYVYDATDNNLSTLAGFRFGKYTTQFIAFTGAICFMLQMTEMTPGRYFA
jgi:hypothetical protein